MLPTWVSHAAGGLRDTDSSGPSFLGTLPEKPMAPSGLWLKGRREHDPGPLMGLVWSWVPNLADQSGCRTDPLWLRDSLHASPCQVPGLCQAPSLQSCTSVKPAPQMSQDQRNSAEFTWFVVWFLPLQHATKAPSGLMALSFKMKPVSGIWNRYMVPAPDPTGASW